MNDQWSYDGENDAWCLWVLGRRPLADVVVYECAEGWTWALYLKPPGQPEREIGGQEDTDQAAKDAAVAALMRETKPVTAGLE